MATLELLPKFWADPYKCLDGAPKTDEVLPPSVARFPDFSRNEDLRIQTWRTPTWVEAEKAAREEGKTGNDRGKRTTNPADSSENCGASSVNWLRWVEADTVSKNLSKPDVHPWNTTIIAHAKLGENEQTIELYHQMQQTCTEPNGHVFVAVLQACATLAALVKGKLIHSDILYCGCESDIYVGNALISMYAKCGSILDARAVFDALTKRDVVTWSALIAGYAQHGDYMEAIQLFQLMQQEGTEPNRVTYVSIVKACASLAVLEHGKGIHLHIIRKGFELDVSVGNILIDMYSKCGSLDAASSLFNRLPKRDVVTWSTLISGFTQHGHGQKALQLFEQMEQEGLEPNEVTYVSLLKACSIASAFEQGKVIHTCTVKSGCESERLIGTTLLDMYCKCGCLVDAHLVFNRLPKRDAATWSALIAGCTQNGHAEVALQLFQRMEQDGLVPDRVTFVCMLKACSSLAALENSKQIHNRIIGSGFESDILVCNALLDMYSKCGSLDEACALFNRLPMRDVVTWNTLIGGFAQHNNYTLASQVFEDMQQAGLKPDDATFICLLSACSHAGQVNEGCLYFKFMREKHGIPPKREHYQSMAELLGHGGYLNKAEDLLETLPFPGNIVGWTSLLSACRVHGNVHVGRRCFNLVTMIDSRKAASYVLMSKTYGHAGMWEDALKVRELRRHVNVWKKPAKAVIEIGNQVHDFVVGDKSHSQSNDIYKKLKTLRMQMRKEGYVPLLDQLQDSSSSEDKEDALYEHCEKLAIAFGLICTPKGTTIRVAKNFRVCADCHVAVKIISKIEMREIIVTDTYCIHRFKDGTCCCKE